MSLVPPPPPPLPKSESLPQPGKSRLTSVIDPKDLVQGKKSLKKVESSGGKNRSSKSNLSNKFDSGNLCIEISAAIESRRRVLKDSSDESSSDSDKWQQDTSEGKKPHKHKKASAAPSYRSVSPNHQSKATKSHSSRKQKNRSSHKGSKGSRQDVKPSVHPKSAAAHLKAKELKTGHLKGKKAEENTKTKIKAKQREVDQSNQKDSKSSRREVETPQPAKQSTVRRDNKTICENPPKMESESNLQSSAVKLGLGDRFLSSVKAIRKTLGLMTTEEVGNEGNGEQEPKIVSQTNQQQVQQTPNAQSSKPTGMAARFVAQIASNEIDDIEENLEKETKSSSQPPANVEAVENADIIVMFVGLTGSGKSSACNMLCECDSFVVSDNISSQTKNFESKRVKVDDKTTISVIDTMGLCDTDDTPEVTRMKITEALWHAKDGVDVIIFCIKQGKLGNLEYDAFEAMLTSIFGPECSKYLILMLTNMDADYVMNSDIGNRWLMKQMQEPETPNRSRGMKAYQRMQYFFQMCHGRVVMVNNMPHSECFEQQNDDELRKKSRENLLDMIYEVNMDKRFVPLMAQKAQEEYDEQKKKEEEEATVRSELINELDSMKEELKAQRREAKQLKKEQAAAAENQAIEIERIRAELKTKELEAEHLRKEKTAAAELQAKELEKKKAELEAKEREAELLQTKQAALAEVEAKKAEHQKEMMKKQIEALKNEKELQEMNAKLEAAQKELEMERERNDKWKEAIDEKVKAFQMLNQSKKKSKDCVLM